MIKNYKFLCFLLKNFKSTWVLAAPFEKNRVFMSLARTLAHLILVNWPIYFLVPRAVLAIYTILYTYICVWTGMYIWVPLPETKRIKLYSTNDSS